MKKLEVKKDKRLVLKNVIIKELRNINIENLEVEIQKFTNYLLVHHIASFGPLITKMLGSNIHDDGNMTFDYDIMIQVNDMHLYKKQFKTMYEYTCDYCIYIHFVGKMEDLQYAHSKLDIYIYENELETNGVVYSIFISDSTESVVIDIFRPIVCNDSLV